MMYFKVVLFLAAILFSVLGGKKLKINAGLIAIALAFVFGITITGLGVNGVVALFLSLFSLVMLHLTEPC